MKYAYYTGCLVPARLNQYDLATRKVLGKLDVELVDLEDAACCGTVITRSIDAKTNLMMSIRILALAGSKKLDLLVTCPGCFESLMDAYTVFIENAGFREEAKSILKDIDNISYDGDGSIVKHLIQVLINDIGLEKIKAVVEKPLNGLKVAAHYGCHILRPSTKLRVDDAENPKMLDELVNATGAESIHWMLKLWCCGFPIQAVDKNLSLSIAGIKLRSVRDAEADCMVTICPSCQFQFDVLQNEVSKITGEQYSMPVILYPQLLGLAIGLAPEDVGLNLNKASIDRFLERLKEVWK